MSIRTIKGFDHNLCCRGKQYEVGKTYEEEGELVMCEHGMHAISPDVPPLKVFDYYPPATRGQRSRYCEVVLDGEIVKCGDKVAALKMTVVRELTMDDLHEWCRKWSEEHGESKEAGDGGAATAGKYGAATAGDYGAATGRGSSSVGRHGVAVARNEEAKARGKMGALLVVAIEDYGSYDIKEWKAGVVDGVTLKADTWYTVENGEWKEVTDEQ
jgi:hypothetical protein